MESDIIDIGTCEHNDKKNDANNTECYDLPRSLKSNSPPLRIAVYCIISESKLAYALVMQYPEKARDERSTRPNLLPNPLLLVTQTS